MFQEEVVRVCVHLYVSEPRKLLPVEEGRTPSQGESCLPFMRGPIPGSSH